MFKRELSCGILNSVLPCPHAIGAGVLCQGPSSQELGATYGRSSYSMKSGSYRTSQRALVLQGGGALGAYGAGTYQEIYKHVRRRENDIGRLFDIVAGTSIGAINAAVLVSKYLRNGNSWEGSDETLLEFWKGLMTPTFADAMMRENPFARAFWNYLHELNPSIADAESARQFWSIFEFSFTPVGVPNMYRPVPRWGSKFLNPFTDLLPWWQYDYQRLRDYLSKFVDFPIKTSLEKGQPRLLLTSVDVQDYSSAVVFDSYEKLHDAFAENESGDTGAGAKSRNGRWYSEYGDLRVPHVVFYDGIGPDQVLASALGKYSLDHPTVDDAVTKTRRQLWDGGYLSNTPLRELLNSHRKYWYEYLKQEYDPKELTKIPELEVYIVNLHPSAAKDIPMDKDQLDDRENDIFFHDRTSFDELVAYLRTDYVDLARQLVDLARSNGLSASVDRILEKEAKSIARAGGRFRFATYRDIIDAHTTVSKVWRIDRHHSSGSTFGKTTDFSPASIRQLLLEGEVDARISLNLLKILFTIEDLITDRIISAAEGEVYMERIRTVRTPEKLYKLSRKELIDFYNAYIATVEKAVHDSERRKALVEPARDIVEFLLEVDTAKGGIRSTENAQAA